MPELPEVETVMRGLIPALKGRMLSRIETRRGDLRFPLPARMDKTLCHHRITGLRRRAKYILIDFDQGKSLLVHLGMSGRMVMDDGRAPLQKHDHVILTTDKGLRIRFHDPRRFGMMDVLDTADAGQHRLLCHLGPEPLEKSFNGAWLHSKLKKRKTAIKLAIMDQELVVGVGNIYACEALFAARISPKRAAGKLTAGECAALARAIKAVLKRAIAKGGSTLRDYVQADGGLGYFQHEFAVYGREGEPCKGCECRERKVKRITQGGRSTFFCPARQK